VSGWGLPQPDTTWPIPLTAMPAFKTDSDITLAAGLIAEIDDEASRNVSNVSPAERARLHLMLSIARSLNSLDKAGIDVHTR
jgi:hypothetical protein